MSVQWRDGLLVVAVLVLAVWGLLDLTGWGASVALLTGSVPEPGMSLFALVVYALAWLAVVTAVPILALWWSLWALWDRLVPIRRGTAP